MGRVRTAAGHAGNWRGRLADVRAWDRVVVADEAATLATRKAQRTGYWMLDEASDGTSPEYTGGQPLTLSDGAAVTDADPIAGTGHLELTGNGGYAATATPPVDTTAGLLGRRVRPLRLRPAHPGHDAVLPPRRPHQRRRGPL